MPLLAEPPQPTLTESIVDLIENEQRAISTGQAASPPASLRITLPGSVISSYWFKPVLLRLQAATALAPAWDSYAAVPVTIGSVEKAMMFLASVLEPRSAPPTVVPLSDGGVQFVWHRSGVDVEATFGRDEGEVFVRDLATQSEHAVDLIDTAAAREAVRTVIDRLRV
jgi:hypothetical protein